MNRFRQLETFARAGWCARGVVYCLLAYLALTTSRATEADPQAVFRSVRDMPGGTVLLALLAFGLILYGAFRLYGAALDNEGRGSDARGIAMRLGYVASGLAHFALAWAAVRLLAWGKSDGEREQEAARWILDLPLGATLLGVIGVGFLAAAARQAYKAWSTDFVRLLVPAAPSWVVPVGRAGLAARAAVFAVIGYSLVKAGWFGAAGRVKGLGDALTAFTGHPILHMLVAAGLFLFGIYGFVEARWRRVGSEDVVARIKAAAR